MLYLFFKRDGSIRHDCQRQLESYECRNLATPVMAERHSIIKLRASLMTPTVQQQSSRKVDVA